MLVGKELPRASIATLDLIADEDGARLVAQFAQSLHELSSDQTDSSHTLDALDDAARHIALAQLSLPGWQVVEGQVGGMPIVVDGCNDLGVVGDLDSQAGPAMKGFLQREDTLAACVETGQFHRVLVGLST